MTTRELKELIDTAIAKHGDVEVMVDTKTFPDSDNGTIFEISDAEVIDVQGADDSGPVGEKYPMLVIKGAMEWHEHGSAKISA